MEKIRTDFHIESSRQQTLSLVVLLAYLLVYLIFRINFGGSLERDEAEVVHMTQQLQLGYGTQPPLYVWLQWLAFSAFGLNRFALVVLKDLILFGLYVGAYRIGHPLLGVNAALASAAMLVFFPQIGWESLRDLTHSVLLTSLACATLWCYFAVLREQNMWRYALLGLLVGLGMQTKYNFALFLTGLMSASLLVREHRSLLWNRKIVVAAIVAIAIFLPHGLWLSQHLDLASAGTLHKLALGTEEAGYLKNIATGLGSVAFAAIAFASLPIVVCAASLWLSRSNLAATFSSTESRFFFCLYGSFFALLVAIVLTGEVGKIKDRWMMPMLFSVPLAAFVMFPALRGQTVSRNIQRVAIAVGFIIIVILSLRVCVGQEVLGKAAPPHHPYPQLAQELKQRFPDITTVITDGTLLAGNLRFARHELRTVLLREVISEHQQLPSKVLMVMSNAAEPGWLDRFRSAYPASRMTEQGKISLVYRFGGKGSMTFDYVQIETPSKP